jgi:N-acetylglucosamine kinase-like BadF-type ATPase
VTLRKKLFLGIEGGATRSTAALLDERGRVLRRAKGGACNLALLSDAKFLAILRQITGAIFNRNRWNGKLAESRLKIAPARRLRLQIASTDLAAVGIFLAGNRRPQDAARVRHLAKKVWRNARIVTGNDAQSAMAAALGDGDGIVVICGTGSIVLARRGATTAQVGGFGSLAGDAGSGYWMGRELLRGVVRQFDETGRLDALGNSLLTFLGARNLEALVQWSINPSRDEVASLTRVLFQ